MIFIEFMEAHINGGISVFSGSSLMWVWFGCDIDWYKDTIYTLKIKDPRNDYILVDLLIKHPY